MSKSALYAGLGRGLMALGNHVGEAYRMQSIEELRQQNLEQNWARQDAVRAEDRAFQAKQTQEQRDYNQTLLNDQREYQAAQTESNREWELARDDQKFRQQKGLLQDTRDYEENKTGVKNVIEADENGNKFEVSYNSQGKEVSRSQLKPSTKMPAQQAKRIEVLTDRYKSLVEAEGAKSPEATMIAREIDALTGAPQKTGEYESAVQGFTAEQVINKFMETNNVDRDTAITLAKQQGRLR